MVYPDPSWAADNTHMIKRGISMKWFKHYSNATSNNFIKAMFTYRNGHELYACWFLLLEHLVEESEKGKHNTEFIVSHDELCSIFKVKYFKKCQRILEDFSKISSTFDQHLLNVQHISDKLLKIETPIVMELLGKEFKRTRHCRGTAAPKNQNQNQNQNKITPIPPSGVPPVRVVEIYNSMCPPSLSKVKSLSDKRRKSIKAMNSLLTSEDSWCEYFEKVLASDFLLGGSRNGWAASFDWLMNKNNALKVLEGNYEKRNSDDRFVESLVRKISEEDG